MFKQARVATLLLSLASTFSLPAAAQDYVVNVHGIVCSFCSYGVAKKVKTLDFIDASRFEDGVKVEIENQMVYVAVRDDAQLDKEALFKAIESGGYKPVEIWSLGPDGQRRAVTP